MQVQLRQGWQYEDGQSCAEEEVEELPVDEAWPLVLGLLEDGGSEGARGLAGEEHAACREVLGILALFLHPAVAYMYELGEGLQKESVEVR